MKGASFPVNAELVRLCRELDTAAVFDDGYLAKLIDYQRLDADSGNFELFYARYAMAHDAVNVALEYALKAYERHKASRAVLRLLAECYERKQQPLSAAVWHGLLGQHFGEPLKAGIPPALLNDYLVAVSLGNSAPGRQPYLTEAIAPGDDGSLQQHFNVLLGKFLPTVPYMAVRHRYWIGIYSPVIAPRNVRGDFAQLVMDKKVSQDSINGDLEFDLMQAEEHQALQVSAENCPCVLPVAGQCANQSMLVNTLTAQQEIHLGKWTYSFYRLTEATQLSSPKPMIVGKPVSLRHSPKRKRLVLNLLIDALPWAEIKRHRYADIPNIMRFFGHGVVFDNNYSVAEYTYPSLASIETGRTPEHLQIFGDKCWTYHPPAMPTLSERMADAGYYCAVLAHDCSGIGNGSLRGYHRVIASPYQAYTYEAVERVIRHLEAFRECDQFLLVHTRDAHPDPNVIDSAIEAQVHVPIADRVRNLDDLKSVFWAKNRLNEYQNRQNVHMLDNALARLFDYLEAHYREDEYVVHLYSDHGNSVYEEEDKMWVLSELHTHAAFMARGGGVPHLGVVSELTSNLDIYPTVLRNARLPVPDDIDGSLPRALGGRGRDYAASSSIYPGQTYKLCLRTQEHEFRLQAKAPTQFDGSTDLSEFAYQVYTRDEAHNEVNDPALDDFFLALAKRHMAGQGQHKTAIRV